jgi:hypothetical protein
MVNEISMMVERELKQLKANGSGGSRRRSSRIIAPLSTG